MAGSRRGRPPKRVAAAAEVETPAPQPVRQRTAQQTPRRTPQTPMEQAAAVEEVYKVDRITGMRWTKGIREYRVLWEGYAESAATWEPMPNLVGCAAQIRDYEAFQKAEDLKAKEDILNKRKAKRDKAAAGVAALRATAAATLAAGEAYVNVQESEDDDGIGITDKGVLEVHEKKKKLVWSCFDLTCEKPKCKLMKTGTLDVVCGE